ncbi:MAG TPA: hypothetical protein VIY90_17810 [Steroidobacteraceae bacterium]
MNNVPVILGIVFLAVMSVAIYLMGSTRRARQRRSPGASHLGWALLFLTSGRMPPPPLETQIEAEANTEKDRNAADPLRQSASTRS